MTGVKVGVLDDACASQPIRSLTAEEAHDAAIQRMAYLFAQVIDTGTFLDAVHIKRASPGRSMSAAAIASAPSAIAPETG